MECSPTLANYIGMWLPIPGGHCLHRRTEATGDAVGGRSHGMVSTCVDYPTSLPALSLTAASLLH